MMPHDDATHLHEEPPLELSANNEQQDLHDRISIMLAQEKHYLCHNYLKGDDDKTKTKTRGATIDASCRGKVCRWIFRTVDCAKFGRETAIVAMSHLDRFLCSSSIRARRARADRREFQLVAMTCLLLAIKVCEPIEMDASTMSALSRGLQSVEDFVSCEGDVLASLGWRLNGPTSLQFSRCILEFLPGSVKPSVARRLSDDSCRQIGAAVEDYGCVVLRRSWIAIAAVLNSLEDVSHEDFSVEERTRFVRAMADDFKLVPDCPLIEAIRWRLREKSPASPSGGSSGCDGQGVLVAKLVRAADKACDEKKRDGISVQDSPVCISNNCKKN